MLITINSLTDFNMPITELIKELEDYKERYGDGRVHVDSQFRTSYIRMEVKDDE